MMPDAGDFLKYGVEGLLIFVLYGYMKINAKLESRRMDLDEKAIDAQRQMASEFRLLTAELRSRGR